MAWIKLENGTYLDPSCVKEVECASTILYEKSTGTKMNSGLKRAKAYNNMDILAKDSLGISPGVVVYSTKIPIPDFKIPEPGFEPELPIETELTIKTITKHVINCLREAEESDEEVIRFKKLVESRKITI